MHKLEFLAQKWAVSEKFYDKQTNTTVCMRHGVHVHRVVKDGQQEMNAVIPAIETLLLLKI